MVWAPRGGRLRTFLISLTVSSRPTTIRVTPSEAANATPSAEVIDICSPEEGGYGAQFIAEQITIASCPGSGFQGA